MDGNDALRPPSEDPSKRSRLPLAIGALLLLAFGFWLLLGRDKVPKSPREASVTETPAEPAEPPAPPPAPVRAAAPAPTPGPAGATTTASVQATDELPPSHPITPERERLQLQNRYIQTLNDAMDLGDGPKLRELAKRFRAEGFDDVDKLGEGYAIVADCLEHPGEASRAAAQKFWDENRASNLRRHLHRHCLE